MRTAQANPAFEPRADNLQQGPIDEGVRVQMMMGIDEMAFEPRGLKKFPLPGDFPAHQVPSRAGKTDLKARGRRGCAPGPMVGGGGNGVVEVVMPADLESGMFPGLGHGLIRSRLGHHQGGTGQSPGKMSVKHGFIGFPIQAKIIGDKNNLLGHTVVPTYNGLSPCLRKFSLPARPDLLAGN